MSGRLARTLGVTLRLLEGGSTAEGLHRIMRPGRETRQRGMTLADLRDAEQVAREVWDALAQAQHHARAMAQALRPRGASAARILTARAFDAREFVGGLDDAIAAAARAHDLAQARRELRELEERVLLGVGDESVFDEMAALRARLEEASRQEAQHGSHR